MDKYKHYFDNLFKSVDKEIILDNEQRKAIIDESQNKIIIAGAGAGKTTTMVGKVKYLVEIKKILPEEILIISFTNKAVNELKERIQKDFQINAKITTFHKLGYEIIKEAIEEKVKIITDQQMIIKQILKKEKSKEAIQIYHSYFNPPIIKKIIINILSTIFPLKLILTKEEFNKFSEFSTILINKNKINKLSKDSLSKKELNFYHYIYNLQKDYQQYNKNNSMIDFEDMIILAKEAIINKKVKLSCQYIIIDEYQDISKNRFELAQAIADANNSKTTVVGDDWQAIFGFAGSEIKLFTDFAKEAKMFKITSTYRNSQELITVVGNFIMQNNSQIKKTLTSKKNINNPLIFINFKENQKVKTLIKTIEEIITEYGTEKNILILGRYNFDIYQFIDNHLLRKDNEKIIYYKENINITYLTVHASKGLGFDNVILINNYQGLYGFPSQVKDSEILKLFHNVDNSYEYAEERRLFYVALTRTKNKVYLLVPSENYSIFIEELIKLNEVNI